MASLRPFRWLRQSAPGRRPPAARGQALAAVLALLAALACSGPRIAREPVYASETVRVQLRRTLEKGQVVPRGYAHPATISDVRLAHVLANSEHRDAQGNSLPTIASELIYELAEALNQAAAKATPDDEIAAAAVLQTRRMGLFTQRNVTAFRMHFSGSDLVFDFYEIQRPLESAETRPGGDDYVIPVDLPQESPSFRIAAGPSQSSAGERRLVVDWRSAFFAKPVSLSVRGGRFQRRTVISEAPVTPPPPDEGALASQDPALRDAQLRALDQLDAARRSGIVTEVEFQKRRRLILEGKLEEAGYGSGSR
jgi:hypothetical protein